MPEAHLPDTRMQKTFSHPKFSTGSKGFTLSEVLITLGIIGIVAAMTLPTLIQRQQRIETSSRLKKFYSAMSQAIMLSELDNGEVKYWPKNGQVYDEDGNYDTEANSEISDGFFRKYIAPYLKYTSAAKDKDFNNYTKVVFADGSVMHFRNGGCYDIYIDTNGQKKPNIAGRDYFVFILCPTGENGFFMPKSHFKAYGDFTTEREVLLNKCKSAPYQCAALLQYDNWEFKDDYPFKL